MDVKYDAWLHWTITHNCSMKCEYCFYNRSSGTIWDAPLEINIPAVMGTLNRTKKTFRIGFTGGEPFLIPNLADVCVEITKNHYISLNTNFITGNIKDFAKKIRPERVIQFVASLHIKELEKRNLTDRFISHYLFCKEKGFVIEVKEVAYPPLQYEIKDYIKKFRDKGIDLAFDFYVGDYKGKKYPKEYSEKEMVLFGLKNTPVLGTEHYYKSGKLCNAGYNTAVVFPDGTVQTCHRVNEKLGNIYKDITFKKELIHCPLDQCDCPLSSYEPRLFEKGLKECGVKKNDFFYYNRHFLSKPIN